MSDSHFFFFFFQAEDGIRDIGVTGVQTCALPISPRRAPGRDPAGAVGQTVPEQLRLDLDLERAAVAALNAGVELCRGLGDNGTRDLVEEILTAEEGHIDWIEEQMELIRQVGWPHYLSQQIKQEDT